MNEVTVDIIIKGPDLAKYMDDIALRQLPFATSKALNEVGRIWGNRMSLNASQRFRTKTSWSRRYQRLKIEKGPDATTEAAAFYSTQTSKKVPIDKMYIRVRTNSWQLAQQTESKQSKRTPQTIMLESNSGRRVEHIAIPIAKNLKHNKNGTWSPNAHHLIRNALSERAFILPSEKNPNVRLLCQRHGTGQNDYKVLYMLVPSVNITPRFNFNKVAEDIMNEMFDKLFDEAMEYAMRTAK